MAQKSEHLLTLVVLVKTWSGKTMATRFPSEEGGTPGCGEMKPQNKTVKMPISIKLRSLKNSTPPENEQNITKSSDTGPKIRFRLKSTRCLMSGGGVGHFLLWGVMTNHCLPWCQGNMIDEYRWLELETWVCLIKDQTEEKNSTLF